VAGTVRETSEGSRFEKGDRVAAFCMLGGFAEAAVAPEHFTFALPEGLDAAQGAGLILPAAPGHPFVLALSARSNVLQEFAGGPGQIAMHGVANIGGSPGTAVSHGCVRLTNRRIRWMAARIGSGVPVTIRR